MNSNSLNFQTTSDLSSIFWQMASIESLPNNISTYFALISALNDHVTVLVYDLGGRIDFDIQPWNLDKAGGFKGWSLKFFIVNVVRFVLDDFSSDISSRFVFPNVSAVPLIASVGTVTDAITDAHP